MSDQTNSEKSNRWSKVKRALKKGAKKLIPVAAGWAAGIFFPPAGAALYSFLKEKIDKSPIPIPISDDKLQKICNDTISEKSVEFLQKKLREALGEVKGITREQLETVLGTVLRPMNNSLNDAMSYIKQFPEQISYLMEEWKAENQELINQLHLDMDAGFDEVKTALSVQSNKIDNVIKLLLTFEDKLDKGFASSVKTVFSADTISDLDLRLTSKAQLSMANYSSRFDIDFDPDLFEPRVEANGAFSDFLRDLTSPFSTGKYLFLVLAGAGMGKTWLSAYWVNRLSEGEFDVEETRKFVPFFFSLKAGLNMQLRGYFNAPDKHTARINLRKAKITSGLAPVLFFDGLDEIKPTEAKDTLSFVLELAKEEIPDVLTCRNTDWTREEKIIEMQSDASDICFEHAAGQSFDVKGVSCKPSLYLGTFTDDELTKAITKYQIPSNALNNKTLLDMAKHPVLLRLFSEYYKKYGVLPDPGDPEEFETIFLGKIGDPPETNVLGRLGIIGKKRDYLVQLTSRFIEKGDKLKAADITELINQEENFKTVRSAGLVKEIWDRAYTAFALNDLYRSHLEHMTELAGVEVKKPKKSLAEPQTEPSIAPSSTGVEQKAPFKTKMVKVSEIETLKQLQSEINKPLDVHEFEVNDGGSVISLNLTSLTFEKVPKAIYSLQNLIEINFSGNSFKTDEELRKMVFNGLVVKLDGKNYVDGQIEDRPKRQAEEKAKKIVSFKGAQIRQFEAEVLQKIEALTKKDFTKVDKVEWTTQMGFSVDNNQLIVIGLYDCGLSTLPESVTQLQSLKELQLWGNGLSTLPESIGNLTSLQGLNLGGNKFTTLPKSITQLKSLIWLSFDNNMFTTLPESLGNLQSLQYLWLTNNKFTTLPESVGQLKSLIYLNLQSNQISTLPESVGNLSSLKELYLYNNELSTFPESITKLEQLVTLNLGYNKLSTFPESITNLKSLQTLWLDGNKLTTLPESLGNLTSLQKLFIHNNMISTLPESVGNLSSLQRLEVYNNQLTTLPESINNLKSLKILWINNNPLNSKSKALVTQLKKKGVQIEERAKKEAEERPKKIVSFKGAQIRQFEADVLQKIEALTKKDFTKVNKVEWTTQMGFSEYNNQLIGIGLFDCGLSTLPESVTQLQSLKELYLWGNGLSTLPESIGNLTSLLVLNLGGNKFTTLPESITQLKSLIYLSFDNNMFTTLPESVGNLSSLQYLWLTNNKFTTLPESIGQLKSLIYLNLDNNQISTLLESFGNLTSLQRLELDKNQLTTLPESINNLKSLKILWINNNPLNSKSKALVTQLKKKGVKIED